MKLPLFIIIGGLLVSFTANAQTNYTLTQEKSEITIKGTSSLHDWESNAEKISGMATITITDGNLETIDKLNLTVEVKSIKSGKGIMDSKTHDAFNAKKNPLIIFELGEVTSITADSIFAKGVLNMAGVKNTIDLVGAYSIDENGTLSFSGSEELKMTDYKMKPPKAMLGSLKTGDDVEVVFSVAFQTN
jgi:polyisoprenoid-binding protein YceI